MAKSPRMDSLVTNGYADDLTLVADHSDGNPAIIPHDRTAEQIYAGMKKLIADGVMKLKEGEIEPTDEELKQAAQTMVDDFTYSKDRSILMRGSGRVISRYNAPGYSCTPRKFNVYRVSSDPKTYATLTGALKAANFDMSLLG